jgi:hypothetical protein
VSDSPLGRYAPAGTYRVVPPRHRAASLAVVRSGADDSGKYSEKKDVDLFEIDTVGDVEGMFHSPAFRY